MRKILLLLGLLSLLFSSVTFSINIEKVQTNIEMMDREFVKPGKIFTYIKNETKDYPNEIIIVKAYDTVLTWGVKKYIEDENAYLIDIKPLDLKRYLYDKIYVLQNWKVIDVIQSEKSEEYYKNLEENARITKEIIIRIFKLMWYGLLLSIFFDILNRYI